MKYWRTQDGRELAIADIELEHLLNIVHDTNFRVARMRHNGLSALGGTDNANVNQSTVSAFVNVQPADIFPAWKAIVKHTKNKFASQFGVSLFDVRNAVYEAWLKNERPNRRLADAVRFCLTAKRRTGAMPPRLLQYLGTFKVHESAEYARMCWNLRVDQPTMKTMISATCFRPIVDKLPASAVNSALTFTRPTHEGWGFMDNWDAFQ